VFSLYMAVFASFSVPYLAIAGELTADPRQRNVLMAWRLVFTAVGVLIAGAFAPTIIEASGGGQAGYETMALVLAVICPVALLIAFLSIGKGAPVAAQAPRVRLSIGEAAAVLARPRFSVLLGANLIQLAGAGMGYAALLYFLTYNMGRADAFQVIGGIVLAACLGIVAAQPLWVWAAARIGKKRAYLTGTVIYALTYTVWAFAAGWGAPAAYLLSFVAAIGNSGWAMLGFSMVSDIAGEDERHAGLYSAAWIATDKIAFALGGTLLVGLLLSGFGFDSARAVAGLPQTPLALVGVMTAFGLMPAAFNLIGGLIFWRWGRQT
jgi:GPH family glycoside/pentoside/hexuronide:cation symporter